MMNEQKRHLLIQARLHQGWAQAELAEHMGVATKTVARWEAGGTIPQPGLRVKLGALLQIDPEELWPLNASRSVPSGPADQVGVPCSQETQQPLALPMIWNVPYPRNLFFTGREDLLSHVRTQLLADQSMALSQSPQAISGLGGIGKTQIAVEYAYRFGQEYQAVLWAHAESSETLVSSYIALAALLHLPEQAAQEQAMMVQAVKRWLQTHREWLLILDNADELALVSEFLPPVLGGHLLLTTRAQAMEGLANRIEVETFSAEQGTLFLLRRAALLAADAPLEQAVVEDRERAGQIVKALGELPLALDQAGAYLEKTGCNHPPVATTWSLSFQYVEEKNPAAADLLRLCAFLQPDAIPEEIILEGGETLGRHLQALAADHLAFHEAIGTLRAYSLLQRSAEQHLLSIHRLVQAVLQDAMPEHERALWRERVIQGLAAVFPEYATKQWRQCERLVPHVLFCATETGEQAESRELSTMLGKAADYLRERFQYEQAERLYQRALRILEQVPDSEHPQVPSLLNRLAYLYFRQGNHEQTKLFVQRTLRICEQVGEPEHLEVAIALRQLGMVYVIQGKDEQAEPLLQRMLRICEQMGEPEHPEVTFALNYLAKLSGNQGKYEQAELLYQRALRIREQAWGLEHPDVAGSLHGLADLYVQQGKYEQAELLYQRVLRIREQAWGLEHPYVADTLRDLAYLYRTWGQNEQAIAVYTRIISLPSNDATVHLYRGYVCLSLKKPDAARADFARYASLEPVDVNAAWMVVWASLGKQHPGGEVTERLEAIAELNPQSDEAHVCRGVALGLRGKLQEGLTALEQAAMESIEQALQIGLPSLLLTPLFWLEQENSHFYQEYAEPLLKRHELL